MSIFTSDSSRLPADKWRKVALAVALLGIVLPVPVCAQGSPPAIEYVSPDQSVWTIRLNERGEPDNPLLSVAAALFAKLGIPWQGKSYPAARMFKYLQDGTAQFSMLVKAPSLQDCCLWSRKPIVSAEIRVYRPGDSAAIKSREDLAGKSVILIRGYSYAGLRDFIADEKNRVSSVDSTTHVAAFRMLAGGRADYLIDYAGPAAEVLAAEPIARIQSDLLTSQDVHLVLSKTYPDAANVMARLEAAAAALDIPQIIRTHGK